jgi:integrase
MQSRVFATKREAQVFEADRVKVRRLGVHAPADASRETLRAWLETWFASGRAEWSPTTVSNRASHVDQWVAPCIGEVRLSELGTDRLYEWRDWMIDSGASPVLVSNVMRTLSAALGEAVDYGKIPANPLLGLRRPKVLREPRKALSAEQAERVRAELPTQVDRVLWGLIYAAGLRTEEALAVRWCDMLGLSRAGGTLTVDRVFVSGEIRNATKTGRGRDVPIVAPLAADLVALREEARPEADDALVCPSRAGTPTNLNNWRNRVFGPAAKAAGVDWATPYTGRHTYISLQIHAGLSPVIVAALAGNSAEIIRKHYAREFDRSRTAKPVPLASALRAARRQVARSSVREVFADSNVVQPRRRR